MNLWVTICICVVPWRQGTHLYFSTTNHFRGIWSSPIVMLYHHLDIIIYTLLCIAFYLNCSCHIWSCASNLPFLFGLKLQIFKNCILDELYKYRVGDSRSIVNEWLLKLMILYWQRRKKLKKCRKREKKMTANTTVV